MQRALSVPALPGAAKIQNDLRILTERLARINDNLARKISSRNEYDKTIQETEGAYAKVRGCCLAALKRHHTAADPALSPRRVGPTLSLWRSICEVCPEPQVMGELYLPWLYLLWQIMESSQTLLHVLKRESTNLTKKTQGSS